MKKFSLLCLILLLVLSACSISSAAGSIIPFKTYSLTELQEDFNQFKDTIEKYHPKLYTDEEELSSLFDTQYKLLRNNMEEIEFYRVLSPIVAKLNCGHTYISFSKEFQDFIYKNGRYLPLIVRIIDNKAYVHKCPLSTDIPVGSEILSINDKTIEEIINIFLDNIVSDGFNVTRKYYIMNNSFNVLYFNYIDCPEYFDVTYKDSSDNEIVEVSVPGASKDQIDIAVNNMDSAVKQNTEEYYQTFDKDYAVLTIKSFAFYDKVRKNKFKAYIDEFFSNMESRKVSNLILDLRDNWGGDPYCTSHLFSYFISEAKPYFSNEDSGGFYPDLKQPITPAQNNYHGKIYILINGASFSSTGHLCALLKFYNIGTFIGEETSGSFICTDSSQDILLSNTGLRLHYSTASWKAAVSGLTPGRGIIPEYTVIPTIQDYLDDRDAILEFTVELIKSSKQ